MIKRYDEYKDSGIYGLGEIPKHWMIKKLKNCNYIVAGQSVQSSLVVSEKGDNMIPFIQGSSEFNSNTFNPVYKNYTEHPQKIVNKDTLLMSVRAPVGELNISQETISIGRGVCGIIGNTSFNRYLFEQMNDIFHSNEKGTTFKAITNGDLKNLESIYPPEFEQQAIATYLDNKTYKIDSAVAELMKQKNLLIELKKSTIHQAVTKGLDSNVEMKDSGVEWIGEVPESWEIKNLKDFYCFSMGNTILKEDLSEKGLPVYSATAEDKFFGFVEKANLLLKKDDLVIPARGNSIGYVKIVKDLSTTTQTTIAAKTKYKVNSKFIYYYLMGLKSEIFKFDNTAIPQYTVETAKAIKTCIPKKSEQNEIVVYLDKKTGQIDQSIEVIDNQIAKMKEYKKTLINDVVTGKIKVID